MASPHLRWPLESGGQPGSSPPKASVVAVVEVVVVVVVVATVVVVVGGVHGPKLPIMFALFVGLGQSSVKLLLNMMSSARRKLKVGSPGVAPAGGFPAGSGAPS